MKFKKITSAFAALVTAAALFTGCAAQQAATQNSETVTTALTESDFIKATYSDEDRNDSYDESTATKITLNQTSASVSGSGASASGSTITITKAGTYILSGTLSDGQLLIKASDKDVVRIVLNNVNITSSKSPAIYAPQSGKTILILAKGTHNTISDTTGYSSDNTPDAAIYVQDDLTINGSGTLVVNGNENDAIKSKDNLVITGGNIEATAKSDCLVGRDSVCINNGSFTLTAENDGIKSTNDEDTKKGYLSIDGGNFNITAACDALQAENTIYVSTAAFVAKTGGGSANASSSAKGSFNESWGNFGQKGQGGGAPQGDSGTQGNTSSQNADDLTNTGVDIVASATENGNTDHGGTPPQMPDSNSAGNPAPQQNDSTASSTDTASAKGIKSAKGILIADGTFILDTADDAIHTNGTAIIKGGKFTISSGDDGIHADSRLQVSGGALEITKSYEGLESYAIAISGGDITLTASDDGLNAAGGSDASSTSGRPGQNNFSASENSPIIAITGGTLTVDATGDGLDSNGNMSVTGGTVIVNGPISGGDGALDYNGTCEISSCTFVAVGNSQMAQSSTNNTPVLMLNVANMSKDSIAITDESGNILLAFTPAKSWNSAVLYCSSFASGKTVSAYTGAAIPSEGIVTSGKISGGTAQGSVALTNKSTTLGNGTVTANGKGQGGRGTKPQG